MAVKSLVTCTRVLAFMTFVSACADKPVPLYEGRAIDILAFSNEPTDTCAGTFEYVDAYAGVLAEEFGIHAPLGKYVWYTPDEYDELLPCGDNLPYPWACADGDTVYSAILPHEHEIVHITNFHTGTCPGPLSEGLAVYYSPIQSDGHKMDFEVLASHLSEPQVNIPQRDYEMLGRFAGFLVETYGLQAILDVCATVGPDASGEQLARALEQRLGASPQELIAALSKEPSGCNDFRTYRSKVFACGKAPAAQDLGVLDEDLAMTIEFGCDRAGTVFAPFSGGIQRFFSFEAPVDDLYWFSVTRAIDGSEAPPGILMEIARCGPCEEVASNSSYVDDGWHTPLLGQLRAGRHSLEIRAPADFSDTLSLEIFRD